MNAYTILPKQFFAMLYTGLCVCLLISQPQIAASQPFTNLYGTPTGEYFTKAIPGTQGIYVLGLENGMVATVSYTDLSGTWQWTHRMAINTVWLDGIIDQNSGNLLTVGCTLPLNSSNRSLIGEFTTNGYLCAKSLEEPGLELLSRITNNFDGTFSAVGLHTTVSTQIDVVVFNLSPNCTVNFKQWFFGSANDLFYNDILTLGSFFADFLVAGQESGNAVIYRFGSGGGAFVGGVQGPSQFDYVDLEYAAGDVLAVANSTVGSQPRIMRFDNSLLPIWEISVNGVSSLERIVYASNGDIFAVGTANVNGLTRAVILKIDDSNGTPQLAWPGVAKYFENGETGYTGGNISLTSNGDLAFADGRDGNPGSFGSTDAFLALTDGDLNSNCTMETMASITLENTLFNAPAEIELLFYDVPQEQPEDGPVIDYEQVVLCPNQNCPPNCLTNMINISTGADPLNPGSYLAPGGGDPMWTLIAAPPSAGLTPGQPAQLIGAFGNAWDQPVSTWLSAFPFNNYGVNNCTTPLQDCSCPPFTYQRCFCICEDGPVTFDFGFWSDNNGKVELWQETTPNSNNYTFFSTLADNCNNLNSVNNFNSPPAGQSFNNPPLSVNTTLTLTKGRYCIRIHNWNISGVAMGVNLLGNVTGLNLETDQCCAAATGTICITKFHDLDCDTIRDFNTSNWTYIDPGLSNWTFNLVGPTNSYVGTTNAQGQVCFTGLPANVPYVVSEVQQSGWSVSTPPNGTITVTPVPFTTTNIEFGNCTEECKCGPYEFLYSVGRGPLLPKYCGDVLYIPDGLPFQFISSFSCIGVCNPPVPTVDYTLTGPSGFVTMSMTGIPATPGYSLPIVASTFTIAGTYTLTVTGHCGNNLCEPCVLTFIYPGDCCKDEELFCANLDNYISVTVDNALCKATLNIGNLPECDTLEWVNWGDNTGNQTGPFTANSMVMHSYSQSDMFVISYLAIEKDPITGLICFEKVVYDTIFLSCLDDDCPLNLVQNGDFNVGIPTVNDEDICNALRWCGIWPSGMGFSTADFYNSSAPPPGTAPLPLTQGNYAAMWCRKQGTQIPWREGIMNELQQTILQNSNCYELEFKLACTGFHFGTPILNAYGVNAPGLSSSSIPIDGDLPPNLGLFPAGDAVLLGSFPIPATCDNNFLNPVQQIVFPISASTFPSAGITHIFLTRDDNTNGGVYIAIDDVCLKPVPCNPVNVNESKAAFPLRIFPNPTPGQFTLELPEPATPGMHIRIIGLTGQLMMERPIKPGTLRQELDAGNLPLGLYFLQVWSQESIMGTEKFVKQ